MKVDEKNMIDLQDLYLTFKSELWGLANRILCDEAEAEDIVHEVFGELCGDPDRPSLEPHPRAYLCQAVRNRATNLIHRRQRECECRKLGGLDDGLDDDGDAWFVQAGIDDEGHPVDEDGNCKGGGCWNAILDGTYGERMAGDGCPEYDHYNDPENY